MSRQIVKPIHASLVALAATVLAAQSTVALAQSAAQGQPSSANVQSSPGAVQSSPATGQAYAAQYEPWAQQNCVDQRTGNTAAGAIIGGALGAIAGSALTHGHTSATLAGGAAGAVAGAEIGASSTTCPPGYVVQTGAPTFVYDGPYYPETVVYEAGAYTPWVWVDGHWIYEPWRHVYRYGRPRVVYHWR